MTIQDVIEETGENNYDVLVIEEGTWFEDSTEIPEQVVDFEHDIARDWVIINDDGDPNKKELHILVQPEKVIKYVHVGAPAPQYAINSISHIRSAIVHAAIQVGIYASEESSRNSIPVDIILEPDVTDEQVEEMFKVAKKYMEDNDYTGVDASKWGLTYDAGTASIEDGEPTRNYVPQLPRSVAPDGTSYEHHSNKGDQDV